MCRKRWDWVEKCFKHFFESFDQMNDFIKNELLNLVSSIEETYQNLEKEIEKVADM